MLAPIFFFFFQHVGSFLNLFFFSHQKYSCQVLMEDIIHPSVETSTAEAVHLQGMGGHLAG